MEEYVYKDAINSYRSARNKYDYFFLAVTVTLLSLSIQTFSPNESKEFLFLIYSAWGLLLISFLFGIYKQEKIILFLGDESDIIYARQYQRKTEESKYIKGGNQALDKTNKYITVAYHIQKWSFVLAIISYIFFKILNAS